MKLLTKIAAAKGLKPTALVRLWILDKLEEIEVFEKTIRHSKGPEETDDPSML